MRSKFHWPPHFWWRSYTLALNKLSRPLCFQEFSTTTFGSFKNSRKLLGLDDLFTLTREVFYITMLMTVTTEDARPRTPAVWNTIRANNFTSPVPVCRMSSLGRCLRVNVLRCSYGQCPKMLEISSDDRDVLRCWRLRTGAINVCWPDLYLLSVVCQLCHDHRD